ncbi:MAG: hypothetical protein H6825_00890 [Planctomycetes bacterium]|nr:hypothetical protein [Planctomycetota bacterium]
MSRTLCISLAAGLLLGAAPFANAQRLLGSDSVGALNWTFTSAPGGPCGAPVPTAFPCPNAALVCPGVPPLGTTSAGSLLGDIADDPLTDTVYTTDGLVITSFTGDTACSGGACFPINSFFAPTFGGVMGPLTGMGCDASGGFTGGPPLLWVTDGKMIAAFVPPPAGACGPIVPVFPPCLLASAAIGPATDVSWDPGGVLWVSFAPGFIQAYVPGGCAPASPVIPVGACPLGPLVGIAVDTSTPNFFSPVTAGYVTDGVTVAYVDLFTGAPAPPTFYTPLTCNPTPALLNGLALAQHGVQYGAPRVGAKLDTFGQASTPGPTFGLEVTGAPSIGTAFLIVNFNFPGPGFFCPPVPGVGTKIWVDPTAPGTVIALPALGPGCVPIPLAIPPAVPAGLEIFAQMVFVGPGGPPALDATNGVEAAIGLP